MTDVRALGALCLALGAGCALPPGSGGTVDGGLLTGGASVRWEPPRANAPAPDWREWNDCLRAQHAMRDGDACRCVVAYRALGDLAEFAHCHARIPRGADRDVPATSAPRLAEPPGGRGADPAGPPDLAAFKRLLRGDEGWSDGGDGHVGYGHRLPLGKEDAEALLDVAARRAWADAEAVLGAEAWAALTRARKTVLASMAYQMGRAGLSGFADMLAAAREGRWEDAAAEMLDSEWAKSQAPARAERLAATMRSGG